MVECSVFLNVITGSYIYIYSLSSSLGCLTTISYCLKKVDINLYLVYKQTFNY